MSGSADQPIPMCDLGSQYQPLRQELLEAVARVLDSGQVILGPEVSAFEQEVAAYCGARHAIACASGSDAISLALAALEIGPGDEVILPPFTFFATVGAVVRLGASPVFVDIEPDTYNIDPNQIEAKITPRTRAIMPVHLYGQCANLEAIGEIAARHNVVVIEDAAQAFGATFQGRQAGTIGGIGCFSFYPSKTLAAYGEAGLVVTNNSEWAGRLRSLRVHGMEPKYFHQRVGWNARIDAVQAALLRVKLPHIDRWLQARQEAARRYDELITTHGLTEALSRPTIRSTGQHVFCQYVVRVTGGRREGLMQFLKQHGVGCEIYYPLPLHLQECLAHLGQGPGSFPVSEAAANEVLALPMFPELTAAQQVRVIRTCADYLRSQDQRAA